MAPVAVRMPRPSRDPLWRADDDEHFRTFCEECNQWQCERLEVGGRKIAQEQVLWDRYHTQAERTLGAPCSPNAVPTRFAPPLDVPLPLPEPIPTSSLAVTPAKKNLARPLPAGLSAAIAVERSGDIVGCPHGADDLFQTKLPVAHARLETDVLPHIFGLSALPSNLLMMRSTPEGFFVKRWRKRHRAEPTSRA